MDSSDSSSLLPSSNPLHITVRFTTAIPDLLLDIPSPSDTTVVALKHLVRSKLDAATAKHRLRLIQSGKLLKDDDTLASTIKVPPPPPRAPDPKGKGKAVDEAVAFRVYINCSIGDPLTEAELSAEASAASNLSRGHKSKAKIDSGNATKSVAPAPRGFDRLLSGGFTAAEVNQLRLQFLSIQSNIHTPDTMPSPSTLRRMEDAWIDDNAGNAGAGEGGFDFGDEGLGGGALDDLLWGNLMGFLWPLGCIGWLIRERGVWSRRRQIAVFTGFMLSVTFGMLRVAS